mgnify:CR=1 FL=1
MAIISEKFESKDKVNAMPSSNECNYCHKEGHFVRDCPVRGNLKCYNSNELGHISRHCTRKKVSDIMMNVVFTGEYLYEKQSWIGFFEDLSSHGKHQIQEIIESEELVLQRKSFT